MLQIVKVKHAEFVSIVVVNTISNINAGQEYIILNKIVALSMGMSM